MARNFKKTKNHKDGKHIAVPTMTHIPPAMRKKIDMRSAKEGKTVSLVIREALVRGLSLS